MKKGNAKGTNIDNAMERGKLSFSDKELRKKYSVPCCVYTPVVKRVGVKLAWEYLRGNLPEVFAANVAVVALHVRQAVALAAAPVTVVPAPTTTS
jgi:hypothetical protein